MGPSRAQDEFRPQPAAQWFDPADLAGEELAQITRELLAAAIPPGGIEPPLRA